VEQEAPPTFRRGPSTDPGHGNVARLCTDNAAMAAVAVEKWRAGEFAPFDLDAVPTYLGNQ